MLLKLYASAPSLPSATPQALSDGPSAPSGRSPRPQRAGKLHTRAGNGHIAIPCTEAILVSDVDIRGSGLTRCEVLVHELRNWAHFLIREVVGQELDDEILVRLAAAAERNRAA